MKIGIPKGLSTYEYPILYEQFFKLLGIEIVFSDDTNKKILEDGIKYSVDENCLASKIYMGHIKNLIDRSKKEKIDYIFIPRIASLNKLDTVCVKFYAMYDICKNVFYETQVQFLDLNVDYLKGDNEFRAFVKLGKKLNKKYIDIVNAYLKARNMQKIYDNKKTKIQLEKLNDNKQGNKLPKLNILIVSHSYIVHDKYMGEATCKFLEGQGTNVFFANINDNLLNNKKNKENKKYIKISNSLYWKYSKDLLNGLLEYVDKVDGIIYLSAFPCGVDSLVNEITMRKIKSVPSISIVVDEQEMGTNLYTRLESFVDILEQNKIKNNIKNIIGNEIVENVEGNIKYDTKDSIQDTLNKRLVINNE